MNISDLKKQSEIVRKLVDESKKQNRIFRQIIDATVNGVEDESERAKLTKFSILTKKAITLAKQGNGEEATELINKFKNGD